MKKWLRNTLVALGILGIAYGQVTEENNFVQLNGSTVVNTPETYDDFSLTGGTYANTEPIVVRGSFLYGKNATLQNSGGITFEGATVKVEPQTRTIIIPAAYGPVYSKTGAVLHATGALVSATGAKVETFIPSLGDVTIR